MYVCMYMHLSVWVSVCVRGWFAKKVFFLSLALLDGVGLSG